MQPGDGAVVAADNLDRFPAGGGERRGDACREHEAVHAVLQVLYDLLPGGDVAAAGSERLGKRSVLDVDIIARKVEIVVTAAAILAYYTAGVGLVNHEEALILLFEPDKLGDGRDVAVHAVDAFDDDENLVVPALNLLKDPLELGKVIVIEGLMVGIGKPDPLGQGIMGQRVIDNEVALAREAADEGHIGRPSSRADNGVLRVLPSGNSLFQLPIDGFFPGEDTGAGSGSAVFLYGVYRGLHGLGIAGHAEVVIRAKIDDGPAVDHGGVAHDAVMRDEIRIEFIPERPGHPGLQLSVFARLCEVRDSRSASGIPAPGRGTGIKAVKHRVYVLRGFLDISQLLKICIEDNDSVLLLNLRDTAEETQAVHPELLDKSGCVRYGCLPGVSIGYGCLPGGNIAKRPDNNVTYDSLDFTKLLLLN